MGNGTSKVSLNFGSDCLCSLSTNVIGEGINPPLPAFYEYWFGEEWG